MKKIFGWIALGILPFLTVGGAASVSVWVGLPRDVGVGAGVCLFLLLCVKEVEFAVKEAEGRIARRQVVAEEAMNSILADLTSLRYTGKIKEPPHA